MLRRSLIGVQACGRLQTAKVPGIDLVATGKPASSSLISRNGLNRPDQHAPNWLKETFAISAIPDSVYQGRSNSGFLLIVAQGSKP
jgi:hypothetical protein